ncbi:hypothetical protein F4782DRAFT_529952 [Xylaria castorea]|nr:hypothetical protein F4782DRAFT_529952 [Xylaria castorea]
MLDMPEFRHIPALIFACIMTFGGMWPLLDPSGSMLEFGLPPHIAHAAAAARAFKSGNARTTVIGLLVFFFYIRNQLEVVDTIMAITWAYCGLVDSYVLWEEGNPRQAAVRLVSSGSLPACGFWGLTAGPVESSNNPSNSHNSR